MALAGLLTAVAVYVVLQDADPGQRVIVATTELQAGTVLPPDAVTAATVDVGEEQAARLVPAGELDAVVGQVVANHLMPGDIVGRSDLRQPAAPEDRRAIALPVPRERAVGGELRTGDRVDVIAVQDGVARYVATGLPVITSGGGEGLDANSYTLTVSVNERDALALARAMVDAELAVTRATGATPANVDAVEGDVIGEETAPDTQAEDPPDNRAPQAQQRQGLRPPEGDAEGGAGDGAGADTNLEE
jgi:Flp pilus assembly protein CpaB